MRSTPPRGETERSAAWPAWNTALKPSTGAGWPSATCSRWPATALLATGFLATVREALGGRDLPRRLALALPVLLTATLGAGLLVSSFSLPFYGQAKSFYALALAPALAFYFARGFALLEGLLAGPGRAPLRGLLVAWLGAFVGVLFLGFAG